MSAVIQPVLSSSDWDVIGRQFMNVDQIKKALFCFKNATGMEYDPCTAAMYSTAYARAGNFRSARRWADISIGMDSQAPGGWMAIGLLHFIQRAYKQAIPYYNQALHVDPANADVLVTLGTCNLYLGKYEQALDLYRRAVAANPLRHDARLYHGMTLLSLGKFEYGFRDYEARMFGGGVLPINGTEIWRGQPLDCKHLAVYMEQGLGDSFMCLRYLRNLVSHFNVGRLTVICAPNMQNFVAAMSLPGIMPPAFSLIDGERPHYHVAAMSLPGIMHTRGIEAGLTRARYISTRHKAIAEIADRDKLQVGLCWRGNPAHQNDHFRSMDLETMAAGLPKRVKADFHPLQFAMTPQEHKLWKSRFGSTVQPNTIIQGKPGLDDLARFIMSVDLVITVDTMVAHMAGALGKPVWIMLANPCDWRWGKDASRRWYSSATLFQQKTAGSWVSVFKGVSKELAIWGKAKA